MEYSERERERERERDRERDYTRNGNEMSLYYKRNGLQRVG